MADLSKPVYGEPWASTGEKVAPALAKIQLGWIQEMMPFQYENWMQNRQDNAISYILQKGVVEWSAEQECIANKTVVTYSGNLYMAITDSVGIVPTTTANWKRLNGVSTADGVVTVAGGGTGATTAANARTNLGLGSIATQNANAVAFTGGTIDAISIGATTRSTGAFTTVNATGNITAASFTGNLTGNVVGNADTVTNGVYTVGAQTIAGNKTFSGVTAVTNATASTTTTTGALTVAGGVGVVGALNVGGGITGNLTGSATSANTLTTGRTIALSGGVTGTPTTFNGSANITIPVTAIDASFISGTASMDIGGNAGTATKLQTPRSIALSGAATGTATLFDGSGNISIPVTALNATNLTSGSVPEARMSAFAVTKTSATGSAKLPAGSDADRDSSPAPGYFRFNTVTNIPEFFNGTVWMTSTGTDLAGLIGTGPSQVPTNAIAGSLYAPISNAALIGVPTAPTAAAGTNTTQIATTAYVRTAVTNASGTAIPGSADLDTYLTPGDYFCASTATAATILNVPNPRAFALNVVLANSPGVIQTFTTYDSTNIRKIYQRAKPSTGSFGLWTRIYTEIDPPTDLVNLNLQSVNGGQLAGTRNRLIDGAERVNQSNFGGNWAGVAVGQYGYDIWKKITSTTKGQVIEAGFFKPNTIHTISGTGVTTAQITSPASGNWTVDVPLAATNVMLEEGTISTPFEFIDYSLELLRVRRYYEVGFSGGASNASSAAVIQRFSMNWSTAKRTPPTISFSIVAGSATTPVAVSNSIYGVVIGYTSTASSQDMIINVTANARL